MALKIGAIIEVVTESGYAYAQYTHNEKTYGHVIRVLKGIYENPQDNLEMLSWKTSLFSTFYALPTAIRAKYVKNIGACSIPESAQIFPLFKQGFEDPETGRVSVWNFWDGEKRWSKKAEELTEEEKNASRLSYPSHDLLVSRIESQWTPQQDF